MLQGNRLKIEVTGYPAIKAGQGAGKKAPET